VRAGARTLAPIAAFVALAAVVLALPAFVTDFRAQQFAYVGMYTVALIGLNVLTGYTGQISLGHGAFMAIGGYTTALLMAGNEQFGQSGLLGIGGGMKDIWTIPIAGLVAGLAGFLFGLPALRLSGLYLALATFAIAVATPAVLKNFEEFTGGGSGINLFGLPELTASSSPVHRAGFELNFNNYLYYLSWSVALVLYVVAWLFLRGRTGRAFRAVRDSETAAVSSGVSLARYKTLAFGLSAAYAGVAGSLFAIATTFVNPDTFPIALSIFLLVGVVVAGLGSLVGAIAGAIFIYYMQISWAQAMDKAIPDWLPVFGDVSTSSPGAPAVVFGVVLILLMFVLPDGVSGLIARLGAFAGRGYHRVR
jgi:branched-chain amino acid transport system permease protein